MRFELVPHPDGPPAGGASVVVNVHAYPDTVDIDYEISAAEPLVLAADTDRGVGGGLRREGLWRHTCGEIFALDPQRPGPYLEFNFSPGGDWAAYAFDAPRRGMRAHDWGGAPVIRCVLGTPDTEERVSSLQLHVSLPRPAFGPCLAVAPTMVIETREGLGYWARQHLAGPADFHASLPTAALRLVPANGKDRVLA